MAWNCLKDCAACCGIVPIKEEIYLKNKDKSQREVRQLLPSLKISEVIPLTEDMFCVFLKPDKTCAIYEDRPDVCKDYGIKPELPCPYITIDGYKRTKREQKSIRKVINKNTTTAMNKLNATP